MKTLLMLCICAIFSTASYGQADSLAFCINKSSVGLGGYDPVSYFKMDSPLQGTTQITADFLDVVYLFSSEENKEQFLKSPEKYLPQYGGWCSMTLAMGRATTPVYDNFLIEDKKLYLFERTLSVNGRELWLQAVDQNKQLAATNYSKYRTTGIIQ